MRSVYIGLLLAGIAGVAFAQDPLPVEITTDNVIQLRPGQSKIFRFTAPVGEIRLSGDGIAKINPLTDRTIAVEALKPGSVMAVGYPGTGNPFYLSIEVEGGMVGNAVKIYGGNSDYRPGTGFTLYYCTERTCGRPNPDISKDNPSEVAISDTRQRPDGSSVTLEKRYR